MRRIPFLLLAALALAPAVASAAARFIVEDGTTGIANSSTHPSQVRGQSVTLVSQACSAGTCSRAAPAVAAEGLYLSAGTTGLRISVCAASGQTLSGAGTMRAYLYSPDAQLWMRNPSLDFAVTVSSYRCQVFPDLDVAFRGEGYRVVYAADAVTASGGSALVVRMEACAAGGC